MVFRVYEPCRPCAAALLHDCNLVLLRFLPILQLQWHGRTVMYNAIPRFSALHFCNLASPLFRAPTLTHIHASALILPALSNFRSFGHSRHRVITISCFRTSVLTCIYAGYCLSAIKSCHIFPPLPF